MKILVIEEKKNFRSDLAAILKSHQIPTEFIAERSSAYQAASSGTYQAVILPASTLKKQTGRWLAQILKEEQPQLPVFLLGDETNPTPQGAGIVLSYPFTAVEFVNQLEKHSAAVPPAFHPETASGTKTGSQPKKKNPAGEETYEIPVFHTEKKSSPASPAEASAQKNASAAEPERSSSEQPLKTAAAVGAASAAGKKTADKQKPAQKGTAEADAEKNVAAAAETTASEQKPAVQVTSAAETQKTAQTEKARNSAAQKTAEKTARPEQKAGLAGFSLPKPSGKKKNGKAAGGKKKKKHYVLRTVLIVLLALCGAGCGYIAYNLQDVPELDLSKLTTYSQASQIYDTNGEYLLDYGSNENITWVSIEDVPQQLIDAFIAIEDHHFYEHHGIDIKRLIGAIWGQLTGTASYGASTITQQLIKNMYLTQEVTYKRKIQEIYLALKLEREMSKDEILEWYLNTMLMGGSNYGVVNAAEDYFGKSLDELTLRECACLAGLVQSPNYYSPRVNYEKGDMTPTNERTDTVLYAMLENDKITEEQYEEAMADTLVVSPTARNAKTSDEYYANAYFIDYAMTEISEDYLTAQGTEITDDAIAETKDMFRNGGYKIYLTIDPTIQETVQTAASEFDNYPQTSTGSEAEFSAVVMDQHTGEVKAIVGGREQATEVEGYNRAVDSKQAVGSSIKPLSVYAPALEEGDYPGTVVDDMPYSIEGYGVDNGYPEGDYTDAPITMRRALELSHNIPAARFLLERVGLENSYNYMLEEGFSEDELVKTAAGLALGAVDVTTMEMTAAYACLANDGVYIEPHCYTAVYDRSGELILSDDNVESHRVFSESTAWLITDMMETNMTEGLGVNARLSTVTSCGKTGTHEHKAISFGGYTHYYTSFLRISTDDYVDFYNSSSYYQSSALWKSYMDPIHEGLEDQEIQDTTAEELGISKYYVCRLTGLRASSSCADSGYAYMEYATADTAPTETCSGHYTDSSSYGYIDPNTGVWVDGGWWDEAGNFHPYE